MYYGHPTLSCLAIFINIAIISHSLVPVCLCDPLLISLLLLRAVCHHQQFEADSIKFVTHLFKIFWLIENKIVLRHWSVALPQAVATIVAVLLLGTVN